MSSASSSPASVTAEFTDVMPALLCGGSGTRLWPLSRMSWPKQFTALFEEHSLLQTTALRSAAIPGAGSPLVICNGAHRDLVDQQLRGCGIANARLILEPVGRNTAPAAAACALEAQAIAGKPDPVILLLASDHVIPDAQTFVDVATQAVASARTGKIVTFGIVPTHPETGYGYVKAVDTGETLPWTLDRFVEKPDLATAETYVASGDYFWNSGMFAARADVLLEELQKSRPDIFDALSVAWQQSELDGNARLLDADAFAAVPGESIDYAVMETTQAGTILPLKAGWNDVGSWGAVWEETSKDERGNAALGDVFQLDNDRCYINAGAGRFVAAIGLRDLVVVDTQDALLIADRAQAQDVRQAVDHLNADSRPETQVHRLGTAPWGTREALGSGVERLVITPGAAVEAGSGTHWVVVSGAVVLDSGEEVSTGQHVQMGGDAVLVVAGNAGAEVICCTIPAS